MSNLKKNDNQSVKTQRLKSKMIIMYLLKTRILNKKLYIIKKSLKNKYQNSRDRH